MTLVLPFLFLAFIVVPVVEIYIITQSAGEIGWPITLALVIAVSMAGAWLVKREGLSVISRIRNSLSGGTIPTNELADGAMIFFASALMLTPGFLTDALGLALLIPPIRALLRPPVISFFKKRLEIKASTIGGGVFSAGFPKPTPGFGRDVYDVKPSQDADLTDITEPPPELDG